VSEEVKDEVIEENNEETTGCCGGTGHKEDGSGCACTPDGRSEQEKSCCGGHSKSEDADLEVEDLTDDEEMDLLEENARLNDQLLRNRAELENFKKRANDERLRDMKYRSQKLAEALIPAIDTFEMAMNVKDPSPDVKNFLIGFEMIKTQLFDGLKSEGIESFGAVGDVFDANLHQAVSQEKSDEHESGTIISVMQKGYQLKDRVIRPAMVKVAE
jgi:molecular chaperone GrpE